MSNYTIYLGLLVIELLFAISFCIYTFSLLFSSFMGSPYVPTKNKEIDEILKQAHLKKNQLFMELGSGDGRVVRRAVQQYGVKGIGVDINALLVSFSRVKTKFSKIRNISFYAKNIMDVDLRNADVLYLFLMPELIKKLTPKLEKELKTGTLIISHGFKIEAWQGKYLTDTISHVPFPTYYYRINS